MYQLEKTDDKSSENFVKLLSMLISNAATSLVSIALTFTLSRSGGLEALSEFGIGYAALSVMQIVERESCLNIALAHKSTVVELNKALTRLLILAAFGSLFIVAFGLVLESTILIYMAWAAAVFTIYDFYRLLMASSQSGTRTLATDSVLVLFVAVAVFLSELQVIVPSMVVVIWAFGLTITSSILAFQSTARVAPLTRSIFSRSSLTFGLQGLLGAGSVHVSSLIVGGTQSPAIVGALRGASTFTGPSNLVTSTVRSAAISSISASRPSNSGRKRVMMKWVGVSLVVQIPLLLITFVIGALWGESLLGDSWSTVQPLMGWVLVDAALNALSAPAHAAHRADLKSTAILKISILSGSLRLIVIPLAAMIFGAQGVVVALLFVTVVSSSLVWLSYKRYMRI